MDAIEILIFSLGITIAPALLYPTRKVCRMSKILTITGFLLFAGLVIVGIYTNANGPTNQPLYEEMAWGDVAVLNIMDGVIFAILAVGAILAAIAVLTFVVAVIAIIMLLSIDRWLKPMRA